MRSLWIATLFGIGACEVGPVVEDGEADDLGTIEAVDSSIGPDRWVTHTVAVAATSDIEITLDWSGSANLNLFLYDPSGALVDASNSTTAMPEVVTRDAAAAGEWVVGIKNKSTTLTASYQLDISVVPLGDDSDPGSPAVPDPRIPIAADLNAGTSNKLGELSGMIRSAQYPGFVWMHRDGHQTEMREELFAMKLSNRKLVAFTGSSGTHPTRRFTFASGVAIDNKNWEEIALGPDVRDQAGQSLYIGDVGNNTGSRNSYQIYQLAEPNPTGSSTTIGSLEATWKFAYPSSAKIGDDFPNCEAMFLLDRNIYIVTKESQPRIYRFPDGYTSAPGTTHTLVQVVNGGTTRVVGAPGNPSYGQLNRARSRFVMGNHQNFKIWLLGSSGLAGDALVRKMLLDPSAPPRYAKAISADTSPSMNAEGATFDAGSDDVVFGTESKRVYHWPAANYQK
jgi:hypothetical protein